MNFFSELFRGFDPELIAQLFLSTSLGLLVGIEREHLGKAAGKRTFALVALGATLYTLLSQFGFQGHQGPTSFDPSRIVSQIVVGMGFLGAGLIVFDENRVKGLTTAAALWTVAAIGATVGLRFYALAIVATLITFFILAGLRRLPRNQQ